MSKRSRAKRRGDRAKTQARAIRRQQTDHPLACTDPNPQTPVVAPPHHGLQCGQLAGEQESPLRTYKDDLVMEKKTRLGRGLDALLGGLDSATDAPASPMTPEVPIEHIDLNPHQARKTFDEDEIASMADSIRSNGVLQPLIVRHLGGRYQLVAGERRLRAARVAGLQTVPIRIVEFNDQQIMEASLVENIQRTDLNPIEKAQGFKDYLERFHVTHDELARRLGLARVTITNLISLLELAPEVQDEIRRGQITLGHAKILKTLDHDQQLAVCKQIIARGLSVHETDALVKTPLVGQSKENREQKTEDRGQRAAKQTEQVNKTSHVESIEQELTQKLATRVEIRLHANEKGHFIIGFESNDDFGRILEVLRRD
jgi:ParB family chromosome partitioning protein